MAETGSEKGQKLSDYPGTLDVVIYSGKEYQVAGIGQFGDIKKDLYKLRDPEDNDVLVEIKGAKFKRFKVKREPKSENIYRKDEDVMITGELVGGKKDIRKTS